MVAAALLAVLLGAAATADAYPLQFIVVTVNDTDLDPGELFDVTVSGCAEGEIIDFRLVDSAASALCVDAKPGAPTGANTASARLSAPMTVGAYDGTVHLASSDVAAHFTVNVVGPDVIPASVIQTAEPGVYDYATILTFILFGLLFLLSCAVAYWYLFLRERDDPAAAG